MADSPGHGVKAIGKGVARAVVKAPVHAYRWTLKPLVGWECRHLPTCSAYALEAIDRNGAWRGTWLALSRICRCHPWGTHGFDPVPDIAAVRHPLAPWRYGRWGWREPIAAAPRKP
jgi:putative membrane protein insertion efficiency factor